MSSLTPLWGTSQTRLPATVDTALRTCAPFLPALRGTTTTSTHPRTQMRWNKTLIIKTTATTETFLLLPATMSSIFRRLPLRWSSTTTHETAPYCRVDAISVVELWTWTKRSIPPCCSSHFASNSYTLPRRSSVKCARRNCCLADTAIAKIETLHTILCWLDYCAVESLEGILLLAITFLVNFNISIDWVHRHQTQT